MRLKLLVIVFIGISLLFAASNEKDIIGEWKTEGGKSIVQIFETDGEFFGRIISLQEPLDEDGNPKLDKSNPKKSLRERKIAGLQILRDFKFSKQEKRWEDGKIYNPEDGKTYSCYLELISANKLKVRGFIGFSLIGKTQIWQRNK